MCVWVKDNLEGVKIYVRDIRDRNADWKCHSWHLLLDKNDNISDKKAKRQMNSKNLPKETKKKI